MFADGGFTDHFLTMTTQHITGKLWKINQWMMSAFFVCLIPWGTWVTTSIIKANEFRTNADLAKAIDIVSLRAEIAGVIAGLPPEEWKKKILSLEEQNRLSGIQAARIEALLLDVRERVIRLDEQHRASDKTSSP